MIKDYVHVNRLCENYQDIENYEIAIHDNNNKWVIHHRLETHDSKGNRRLVDISVKELKALNMYWHRPANELIFMIEKEHLSLHNKNKKVSKESRKKMSLARVGKPGTWIGKHHTEESKVKMAKSRKDRKRVLCVELKLEFDSLNEASKWLGKTENAVRGCIKGKWKCGGFHWEII